MSETAERAYAKLNLSLDVLGVLENGYHELLMVMQSVDLCDDVHIALTDGGALRVRTNLSYLPRDERNLAAKAARTLLDAASLPQAGAEIGIHKRIPVGAGLGGGSADAAAVLRGLNRLIGSPFDTARLEELGAAVGSDVPFCIAGGTVLASGRGERLTPLPSLPGLPVVICKPAFPLSTPELFARIDGRASPIRPDTEGLLRCITAGDTQGLARRMYNVFEDVLPRSCSEISVIRGRLLDLGAQGAVMTGTGSAVFGLFRDADTARGAQRELARSYADCFFTETIGRYA